MGTVALSPVAEGSLEVSTSNGIKTADAVTIELRAGTTCGCALKARRVGLVGVFVVVFERESFFDKVLANSCAFALKGSNSTALFLSPLFVKPTLWSLDDDDEDNNDDAGISLGGW